MTPRSFFLCCGLFAALVSPACGQAQGSGTRTNWLRPCDADAECGGSGTCQCGLCTAPCDGELDCDGGVCSSEISTAVQCEGHQVEVPRLCLPEPQNEPVACRELPLRISAELGDAALACDRPGALVCESFDEPLPDTTSTWLENDAEGALQECVTQGGAGALVERTVDDGRIQTRFRLPEPVASGTLHVRFYLRIGSSSVLPEQTTVFELWDQEEAPSNQTSLVLTREGDLAAYISPGAHVLASAAPAPLPRDTWLCIELADQLGSGDGSFTVSVDGTAVLGAPNLVTMHPNPLIVAVLQSQPTLGSVGSATELFFDELVIGSEPIGCP